MLQWEQTGLRRAEGHSGGLPATDTRGPAPPAAVKSPHACLGVTISVQRKRTSPAARPQLHHGIQALAGDPQAAHPFPAGHPDPPPASNQPEFEPAHSWGRMLFCKRVLAGLLTQHPALLPALRPCSIDQSPRKSPTQQPWFRALLPGRAAAALALRQGCQCSPRCRQSGTARQPSRGSRHLVPLLHAGW